MGTGYSPVGLALRDVGANFGNLLEQEARRRDQDLQQQVALGQLGLQGQQFQNQAAVQQAQAGVSLAEVGAKGRYQDQSMALQQEQNRTAAAAQQANERYGLGHLKILQDTEARLGPSTTAETRARNATAGGLETANAAANVRFPVADVDAHLRQQLTAAGRSPEEIEQRLAWGKHVWDNFSSATNLPVDETTGKPYVTQAMLQDRMKYTMDLDRLNKSTTVTAEQLQKHRDSFLAQAEKDPTMAGVPYEDKIAIADALALHPQSYYTATQKDVPKKVEDFRQQAIAQLIRSKSGMFGTYVPTPEDIQTLEQKIVAPQKALWHAETARQVLQAGAGQREITPTPAPPPPAGVPAGSLHDPMTLKQAIVAGARARGLDPAVALSVFQQESSFSPNAPAEKGGTGGLSQFQLATAHTRHLDLDRLRTDPWYNLNAGLDYLADLKKQHGEQDWKYVQAYNGLGKGAGDPTYVASVRRWVPANQQFVARTPALGPSPGGAAFPAVTAVPAPPAAVAAVPPVPFGDRTLGQHLESFGTDIVAPVAPPTYLAPTPSTRGGPPVAPSLAAVTQVPTATATVAPPTATSAPAQDAAYRAQHQGAIAAGTQAVSPAGLQLALERRYAARGRIPDGVHAVPRGDQGVYLVTTRAGKVINVTLGEG